VRSTFAFVGDPEILPRQTINRAPVLPDFRIDTHDSDFGAEGGQLLKGEKQNQGEVDHA
jgi:hypothetical protein